MARKHSSQSRQTGRQLRIIAGQWRGRKLSFPDAQGLRPTPDRVRETLFNWLAPVLPGAKCLDLYAGSGALAFEALSRGAGETVAIDLNPAVTRQLLANKQLLNCSQLTIITGSSAEWLRAQATAHDAFDIVFIDPPYHQGLVAPSINALESAHWIKDPGWIYIETASDEMPPIVPGHWQLYRHKIAGQVSYALYLRSSP